MSAPPTKTIILLKILSEEGISSSDGKAREILRKKFQDFSGISNESAFAQLYFAAKKKSFIETLEEKRKCFEIEITKAGKSYLKKHRYLIVDNSISTNNNKAKSIEANKPKIREDLATDETQVEETSSKYFELLKGVAKATQKLSEGFEEIAKAIKDLSKGFDEIAVSNSPKESTNNKPPSRIKTDEKLIDNLFQKLQSAEESSLKLEQDNRVLVQEVENLRHELNTVRKKNTSNSSTRGIGIKQVPKRLQPAYRAARKQGWTVKKTNGGHIEFVTPEGGKVIVSSTPSDHRSIDNSLAELKRNGLYID